MNKRIFPTIFILLIFVWMFLVFFLSSEVSVDSTSRSQMFVKFVSDVFDINDATKLKEISFFIRKLAHFSLYALGGMLTFLFACFKGETKLKRVLFCECFGFFYAMSDEFHQVFVSGRSGTFSDVLIDSVGFLFGICIVLLFKRCFMNRDKGLK